MFRKYQHLAGALPTPLVVVVVVVGAGGGTNSLPPIPPHPFVGILYHISPFPYSACYVTECGRFNRTIFMEILMTSGNLDLYMPGIVITDL